MLVSLVPGQVAKATISPTAKGNPSQATIAAGIQWGSSDNTVFTVVQDPNVPNGCIITGIGTGTALSATIQATCQATEPDGVTKEQITGTDTVACSLVGTTPPPSPVADGLVFTLTSSVPTPPSIPAGASAVNPATPTLASLLKTQGS